MSHDEKKPEPPITFTEMEQLDIQKMNNQIQTNFLKNHPEITSPANSDLAQMIRDEKTMYANMAILFACNFHAAMKKRENK